MSDKKDVQVLTHLRKGVHNFQATGYSCLKVTHKAQGDKKTVAYKIPIKSQGITELLEQLRDREPRPPSTKVLITPRDDVGQQLRISRNQWVIMPDFTDPKYIEEVKKSETEAVYMIVAVGLDLDLQNERGDVVHDPQEKVNILKDMGFSMQHFQQLAEDVKQLTEWAEGEQEGFFDTSSDGKPIASNM